MGPKKRRPCASARRPAKRSVQRSPSARSSHSAASSCSTQMPRWTDVPAGSVLHGQIRRHQPHSLPSSAITPVVYGHETVHVYCHYCMCIGVYCIPNTAASLSTSGADCYAQWDAPQQARSPGRRQPRPTPAQRSAAGPAPGSARCSPAWRPAACACRPSPERRPAPEK